MEVLAVDKLIEKARFHSDVAVAIAEAMDITIQAHQFVTVPMLDARFAALERKLEIRFAGIADRFASLEKSIESAKVWAMTLHVGLTVTLFGALAFDTHWLVTREDQLIAQVEARSDQKFKQVDARFEQIDNRFKQVDARFQQVDARFQQVDAHLQQVDAHLQQVDAHLQQVDAHVQQVDAHLQQLDAHFQQVDTDLKEIRALLIRPLHPESK